jgi:CBS-domain-containing membrane protein
LTHLDWCANCEGSDIMIKLAMERVVRVQDVMSRDVVTLRASMSVEEAARRLHHDRIGGAPVTTESGQLLGVVGKTDLLDPRHHARHACVRDAMTRVIYAVRPSDPVMVAVKLMIDQAIHRALVVDDHGRLAGIVTPIDVMKAMLMTQSEESKTDIRYVVLDDDGP